jgi:hypothetical protein
MVHGRSNDGLDRDTRDLPGRSGRNCCEEIRQNLQQILNAVALAVNQNDRDRELGKVLLEGEVLVDSDEDVELRLGEGKQLSIRVAGPALTQDGVGVEPYYVGCETSVNTLVEQNPQAAAVTARSAAFSRNVTT